MLSVNYAECRTLAHYAECHLLSVVMLSAVMLNVVAPRQGTLWQNNLY
jgi:hypothetical protein